MNRRTQAIIGATIVVLGLGFLALGALEQEDNIRRVEDVRDDPRLASGTYTVLGVPAPPMVPVTGPNGVELVPNQDYTNRTSHAVAWTLEGTVVHSSIHITVDPTPTGHIWHYENITRVPGQGNIVATSNFAWETAGVKVFQIRAFDDGDGDTPVIWGVYDGVLRDAMQPKPSQFEGSLAKNLQGTPMPRDALIWDVGTYTAGCSSKFLPPEEEAKYA